MAVASRPQSSVPRAPVRYFVVDDYPLFVTVLADVLEAGGDFQSLGVAHTGREALEALRRTKPDLVVLDLFLPDLGGLELIGRIRAENLAGRIIVCSALTDDETIEVAFALGADGFVEKTAGIPELLAALRDAAQGVFRMDAHVSRVRQQVLQFQQTRNGPRPRDYRVLLGLLTDRPARAIAAELGISLSAVYKARQRLAPRFAVQRGPERLKLAARLGLAVRAEPAAIQAAGGGR